jgi:segregation and condensation protein A
MENAESSQFLVKWNTNEGGWTEGTLSVLWSLIESYKVDIFEVSLSRITEDFIQFLRLAKNLPIELSSEFIKMAASLVYLKSKALLPNPGFEEPDSEPTLPRELVDKLLEHKKYQIAGQKLAYLDLIRSSVFPRESNQILIHFPEDENWLDVDLIDLISAFNGILSKEAINEEIPKLLIADSTYSISEKIRNIETLLSSKREIYFSEIFLSKDPETLDIVYSFLAILEIVKLGKIQIKQHKMFGDIKIFSVV